MIKRMFKLLIDKKSEVKVLTISESTTQAFNAFQEKTKEPKERRSSSKEEKKDCIYCLSDKHGNTSC